MADIDTSKKADEDIINTEAQAMASEVAPADQASESTSIVTPEVPPVAGPENPPVISAEPVPIAVPPIAPPEVGIEREISSVVQDLEGSFTTTADSANSIKSSVSIPTPEAKAEDVTDFSNYKPPVGFMAWLLAKARAAKQARREKKLNKIMLSFEKKNKITNDDIEKLLHLSHKTATNYLNDLIKRGRIRRLGQGSTTYYEKI